MKRFAVLLASLTLALCFLLVGCSGKPNAPADSDSPAHTHIYSDWVVATPATCQKEGQMKGTCSCGKTELTTIKKTDHNFVNHACTMCGKRDSEVPFVSDYTAGKENTVGNTSATAFALQDGWVYAGVGQQIVKYRIGSKQTTLVYSCNGLNPFNVNVVGDWIYFSLGGGTASKCGIAKVRTDGQGFELLLSSVNVGEMLVVKQTIYYTSLKEEYNNYAKDASPLYSMSVNGGGTKQVHDGYVRGLCATGTHIFFLYEPLEGIGALCRIKHNGTNLVELLKQDIVHVAIGKDKLYITEIDENGNYLLSSIGTNGGAPARICSVWSSGDTFLVSGKNVFYNGFSSDPATSEDIVDEGIILLDTSTKKMTFLHEAEQACYAVGEYLMLVIYSGETPTSIKQYDVANKTWSTVTIG